MSASFQDDAEGVEAAFYEAFARLDMDLMSAVWLDGLRPVCIHPGGPLLQGKDAVLHSWAGIFDGSQPPIVEHRLIDRIESGDLAIHLVEERIRPRSAPADQANRVIATNVYLRESGAWYMIEHHGSLPLIEQPASEPETRSLH
jgi:ketosteroid isomerase-like protein